MTIRRLLAFSAHLLAALLLVSCGGGGGSPSSAASTTNPQSTSQQSLPSNPTYTVAGTLSGLNSGATITLLDNGGDALTLTTNGEFIFSASVNSTTGYLVTISTQPGGQVCHVANAGANDISANISNVSVTCSTPGFQISGAVNGLAAGEQVTLLNNGGNPVTVTGNDNFSFTTAIDYDGSYAVTVGTQPRGAICSVQNGSGSGVVATISNVMVNCSASSYSISGTVSGLLTGQQVKLFNNGTDEQTITSNGGFAFDLPVSANSTYAVTVDSTLSAGQTCSVSNGSGNVVSGNITNVKVTCSTQSYSISATVTGLATGQQVTLYNNGADPHTINSNQLFTFNTAVAPGSSYSVTVGTQPTVQRCVVKNGSGQAIGGNINNIQINCSFNGSFIFSPYMYAGDYNEIDNLLTTAVTGVVQPAVQSMPSNLNALTWAFATSEQNSTNATDTCGSENWSGTPGAVFAAANVPSFVNAGKYYIVSTGGSGYNFFCSSDANFIKFIQTYYSNNMIGVDFDIETSQSQADVNNLVKVVTAAQSQYPNLRYSFTIAANGGTLVPNIGKFGAWVMNAIQTYGLKNYTINLMVMDYASSGHENAYLCTLTSKNLCDMGASAIVAAQEVHDYYGVPYSQIEFTAMVGGNDAVDEVFTIANTATLSNFALQNKMAGIHFWAFSRDRDCAPVTVDFHTSDMCNNYGKAGTLGYTYAFLANLGL